MRKLVPIAAVFVALSASAVAQDKASQKFITEAIQGNHAEVQMGQLAQQNGQSSEVKAFGQMLQNDHGAAVQKAQEAAKGVGASNIPAGPNANQKASKKQDAAGQYAQQTLPTLQKHLETAQSIQKQVSSKR